MHVSRRHIAEDQCIEILPGLITKNARIAAVRRIELVLSTVADPGWQAEEESQSSSDVNRIDEGVAVRIGSCQPASGERSSEIEEMPLDGDHIHGGDPRGAWCQGGLARRHGIAPARDKICKGIAAGAVG